MPIETPRLVSVQTPAKTSVVSAELYTSPQHYTVSFSMERLKL